VSGERSGPQDLLETRSPLRTRKLPLLFVWVRNGREEEKFRKLNPEFTLYWKERTERSWGGNECSAVAHFVKDAETGHYNIYEASYLDACWKMTEVPRINKNSPLIRIPKPISFEPKRGKFRYAGRSDNEQLIAVKVWKHVQKEEGRKAKARRKIKR